MNLPPALRDLREDLVVAAPDDFAAVQAIVREPAPAGRDVAHLPVQHGNGGRRVVDEYLEELPRLRKAVFGDQFIEK